MPKPPAGTYRLNAPPGYGTGWIVRVDGAGLHVPLPAPGNLLVWVDPPGWFVRADPPDPEFWIKFDEPVVGEYDAQHGANHYHGTYTTAPP